MPRRFHSAFTLAEVLLAIALIALLSGLIAGAGIFADDPLGARPPDKVAVSALKRARLEAIDRGRETSLIYDPRGFFLIYDSETAEPVAHIFLNRKIEKAFSEAEKNGGEVDWDSLPNNVIVVFHKVFPELLDKGSVSLDREIMQVLRFSPDSTMTPAIMEVNFADTQSVMVEIDPFCAAPIQKEGGDE